MATNMFGERLRELRDRAGLTQTQLAEKANMHRQGIAKLEMGEREPTWATVQALADALGISCEDFRVTGRVETPGKSGISAKSSSASASDMPPTQRKPRGRKMRKPRG